MITINELFLVQMDLNLLSRKDEKNQRDSRCVMDKKIEVQRGSRHYTCIQNIVRV